MVAPTAWHTSSAVDSQSHRARACPSLAATKQSLERDAPVDDHDPSREGDRKGQPKTWRPARPEEKARTP